MPRMTPGGTIPKRRSRLALDGNVAGILFTRHRGGRHYVTVPINFGGHQDQYDIGRMFYQDTSSHYRPPDPWFDHFHVRSTPLIRLNPPERHFTPHVRYNDSLMAAGLSEQAFGEIRQDEPVLPVPLEDVMHGPHATIHGTPTPEEQFMMSDGIDHVSAIDNARAADGLGSGMEMQDPIPLHMLEAEQAMPHAGVDSQPVEQVARPDMFSAMPMPNAEMSGLEQIVNGLMPRPADPMNQDYGPEMTNELFEQAMYEVLDQQMPEPTQPDPYAPMQAMYDEQLAMLMNPYMAPNPMMPGPGVMPGMPDPMGPMPGP